MEEQIKQVENNKDLNDKQKQRRIDTRYKEAIIKIYALEYIKTYLSLGNKPEKYLWALLDLTSLLQSSGTVHIDYTSGKTVDIKPMPRLMERTYEMQNLLTNIATMTKYSFYFGDKYEKSVIENADKQYNIYYEKYINNKPF